MKHVSYAFAILASAFFTGCSNPADNVPAAAVNSNTNTQTAAAAAGTTQRTFSFGPENSKIEFIGSKVTGKHDGGFKQFSGELRVANGRVADTGNKVSIDTTSLWADNDRLTGHLKSPDFFNVAQMPTATFETTSITKNQTNSTVSGNLTLHGVTKQISFPAQIEVSDQAVALTAQFFINRFDFDIKYPGKANDLIRKEVVIKLKLNAVPSARSV
jgi:polyisoprenoid-binding protein YceI